MSLRYIFVFLLLFSGTALGVVDLAFRSVFNLLPSPTWKCDTAIKGYSCRDCNTLQRCEGSENPEYTIICKDQDARTPYCSPTEKKCVADKTQCNEIENSFVCPHVGNFADPTDCRKFTSCIATGAQGITYHCMYNSIFDERKGYCVSTGVTCYTATAECAGKQKVIPYKPNPSFYVICRGSDTPALKYCGSPYSQFNPTKLTCEFVCKSEGIFPDHSSVNHYYVCVRSGTTWTYDHRKCPRDGVFDEAIGGCVSAPPATTTAPGDGGGDGTGGDGNDGDGNDGDENEGRTGGSG